VAYLANRNYKYQYPLKNNNEPGMKIPGLLFYASDGPKPSDA